MTIIDLHLYLHLRIQTPEMINKFILIIFLLIFFEGPDKTSILSPPLDIPLVLSANFGEPRTGHFHSGVDFKTGGKTGQLVHSAADGYIYRIVVSPTGFGKALYIRHNNGLSTVYGHLSRFTTEIDEYVKDNQYAKKSFSVNLFPPAGKFKVNEGELIGYSGNSGSSLGPHLHFEVRRSSIEKPLDPIQFYEIEDNIRPVIRSVAIYPAGQSSTVEEKKEKLILRTKGSAGNYTVSKTEPVTISGPVGFGINTYDFIDNSWNKCGVRIINLKVDNRLLYSHSIDEFAFSETRYINSHIDYEEKIKSSSYIQKTFLDPNNKLSIYNHTINNGIVELRDGKRHEVEISTSDFNDNYSSVRFYIIADTTFPGIKPEKEGIMMPFGERNQIAHHDIRISFPPNCFYDTVFFDYRKAPTDRTDIYSDIHFVHNKYVPVHQNFDISIKPDNEIKEQYFDKLCLVYMDDDKPEDLLFAGGKMDDGFIVGSTRDLGLYAIGIDTVPPILEPARFSDGATIMDGSTLKIKMEDDFSGIGDYAGYVDGKWALFEWDPKNSTLTYIPDPDHIKRGGKHSLLLKATDNRDNEAVLKLDFYW